MGNMKVHYSSETNEWATPQDFYDKLDKDFNFNLDPCSTKDNAKCDKFFTIDDDGLAQSWVGYNVFMNPPYGREIKFWIEKALKETLLGAERERERERTIVVCLIPARTDTQYWHDYIFGKAKEVRFVKGRLKFGDGKNSAPFPSAVVVFDSEHNGETKYSVMDRL